MYSDSCFVSMFLYTWDSCMIDDMTKNLLTYFLECKANALAFLSTFIHDV